MSTPKGTKPWNAGTAKGYVDGRGYRCFTIGNRTFREHRMLMEAHLGRKLEPWEHVHHINQIKTDNRIENLRVVTAAEHMAEHGREQRSDAARMTMAIHREMRSEIQRIRKSNAAMYEALKAFTEAMRKDISVDFLKLVELLPIADAAIKLAEGGE